MTEVTVIQKIRSVLTLNAVIAGYVGTRVYAQHPSELQNPEVPCITITVLDSKPNAHVYTIIETHLQIDLWFPIDTYTIEDVITCAGTIRSLLHKQDLWDSTLGLKSYMISESGVGPILYDADIKSHHLPLRYRTVAS